MPAAIEEELWFGGSDTAVAEDAAAKSMAALVGRIVGAKPFPESARKLAELTRRDVVRIEPIIQVLERDPALSARLLRLVNSAGYALRQRCTSVRHAATLVGTDRLHQIATTAAVLELFDSRGSIATKIVEHCTVVGAFCRYFGAHLALPVDDLFTAGFLHDIGKLMLLETEGDQYFALLEKFADRPDSIHVVERSLYGFDHAVLAAHVLSEWNIPDPVPKIVAWHHDPTRAYRVSSMMAALVQTVRLADLAVYAMVSNVDQEHFSTLAATESANYLDISEPQLASMWDELQTLYHESVEQLRGDNAPALDPRSLRPKIKLPLSLAAVPETVRTTELPLQYPCVVCGHPSFGNTCGACGGHVCPEHQAGREDWCSLCARDYEQAAAQSPWPLSPLLTALTGLSVVVVSIAIGFQTGGTIGGVRAGSGTLLLLALVVVLAVVGRRLMLRIRFARNRPNRAVSVAQGSDGGTQSLVPAVADTTMGPRSAGHDALSEQLRASSAAIEHILIREAPSVPSIIAPKPFEGLTEAGPPSSRRSPALENVPIEQRDTSDAASGHAPFAGMGPVSSERLAQQGRSLVTLPAPSPIDEGRAPGTPTAVVIPSELIDLGSDERTSELGLNALDAAPGSDPPAAPAPHPLEVESGSRDRATAVPRFEVSEKPEIGAGPHPLAALGIRPPAAALPPPPEAPSVELPEEPESPPPSETTAAPDRTTLLGLSAEHSGSEPSAQPPRPRSSEPPPAAQDDASQDVALSEPRLEPCTSSHVFEIPNPRALSEGDSSVEVPPAPTLLETPARAEAGPIVGATPLPIDAPGELESTAAQLERQLLERLGPELEAKILDLVATRVAAVVAERMLDSLGTPVDRSSNRATAKGPKPSKAPKARVAPKTAAGDDTPHSR